MSKVWYGGGILANGTGEPISDATGQWMPLGASVRLGATDSGHETAALHAARVGGTISAIYTHVRENTESTAGSWLLRFMDYAGGSPTYQDTTISIADGATGAQSDLATSITATAGNEHEWKWERTGVSSGNIRIPFLSFAFTPTDGKSFQLNTFERPGLSTASATRYAPPVGDNVASTEQNSARIQIKVDGVITHFGVRVFANGRSTDTTFHLMLNGAAIGSGITFAGGATGFDEDDGLGTPVAVANGDYLAVRIVTGTGTGTIEWTVTPVTITPTANEWMAGVSSGAGLTVNQGVTTYIVPIGDLTSTSTTDGNAKVKAPFAMTLDRFRGYVRANNLNTAPGFAANIRVNGVTQQSLTWAAGSGAAEATNANSISVAAGDDIDIQLVAAGGTGSAQLMNIEFRGVEVVAASTGGPVWTWLNGVVTPPSSQSQGTNGFFGCLNGVWQVAASGFARWPRRRDEV